VAAPADWLEYEERVVARKTAQLAAQAHNQIGADENIDQIQAERLFVAVRAMAIENEDVAGLNPVLKVIRDMDARTRKDEGDFEKLVPMLPDGVLPHFPVDDNPGFLVGKKIPFSEQINAGFGHGGIMLIFGGIFKEGKKGDDYCREP
jgi:hypothetical protein